MRVTRCVWSVRFGVSFDNAVVRILSVPDILVFRRVSVLCPGVAVSGVVSVRVSRLVPLTPRPPG